MPIDPAVLGFLGGATVGAIFSGGMKILADYVKDARDRSAAKMALRRNAYAEWAGCIEEARTTALHHAFLRRTSAEEAVSGGLPELHKRAFEVAHRVGAAWTRLALLEDATSFRDEARKLSSRSSESVVVAAAADRFEVVTKQLGIFKDDFDAFLSKVADREARARARLKRAAAGSIPALVRPDELAASKEPAGR